MPSSGSFLRQLSGKEGWKSTSRRWGGNNKYNNVSGYGCGGFEASLTQIEGLNMYGNGVDNGLVLRKRVMIVVDESSHSKHAMIWALSHVANKADLLTLLHVVPPLHSSSPSPYFANSLGSLCKACKPEVQVEALVIQGPKLATVMSQVKKLEVSVLVLGQKRPAPFLNCICGGSSGGDDFVERCINSADCLTIGVKRQSRGVGGYLVSTRWQKDFWLLA
ncbi:UDP-galactose transporter 1-like [Hibiscus syriacus]|uniref:UDP-galactose transporter 1-like n=1 Tax=Hibiscus syriacus TaxID=106335 RepID=A0A6A3BNM2_HIBSY|nr:uncharacterized protein LOC120212214 [Hibiscus syriacus]KAE8718630.1 UDP-galactose transporter 1-like [Hibiscus syriacus]